MALPFAEIQKRVKQKLGTKAYNEMFQYLTDHPPTLCGENPPSHFLEKNFVFAMYKDLEHHGYQRVMKEVKGKFPGSSQSFAKNTTRIRDALVNWAEEKIQPLSAREWRHAARGVDRTGNLSKVYLWMQSEDFPKEYHRRWTRDDSDFSPKLKRLGRRYMFVRDANGKILYIWGGYTPQLGDGEFVEIKHKKIEQLFGGVDLIAGKQFEDGNRFLENCHIWTDAAEPKSTKRKRGEEGTSDQKKYKRDHHALKNHVDDVFGWMRDTFKSLAVPWSESEDQQDDVVLIAAAAYNCYK